MDRGNWQAPGVTKSWTRLSSWTTITITTTFQGGLWGPNEYTHHSIWQTVRTQQTPAAVWPPLSPLLLQILFKWFRTDLWTLRENKAGVSGSWSRLCSPVRKGEADWGHSPIFVSRDASPWLDGLSGADLCSGPYFPTPLCCLSAAFHPKIGRGSQAEKAPLWVRWGEEVRWSSACSSPKFQELVRQHLEVTPVTAS